MYVCMHVCMYVCNYYNVMSKSFYNYTLIIIIMLADYLFTSLTMVI